MAQSAMLIQTVVFHRGVVEHTRICHGSDIYVTKCVIVGNWNITIHQNVVALIQTVVFHPGVVEHTRICRGSDIYVTKCVTVGN